MAAKRSVIWSPEAQADLSGIWDYYAQVASPRTADNIVRRIAETCQLLEEGPYIGRARDEVRPGLRSMVASPYVIFYRVRPDRSSEVVRVIDGRRDIEAAFDDSES